jgi:hypothetical protein
LQQRSLLAQSLTPQNRKYLSKSFRYTTWIEAMKIAADILVASGLVAIATAATLVWVPLGIFTAGLALIFTGLAIDPRITRKKDDS